MPTKIWKKFNSFTYLNLFSFSSAHDKFLIVIGILCAIIYGQKMLIMAFLTTKLTVFFTHVPNLNYPTSDLQTNGTIQRNITDSYFSDEIKSEFSQLTKDAALTVFVMFFIYFGMVTTFKLSARNQTIRVMKLYMESLVHQDMEWFESCEKTGNLVNQTADDFQKFEDGIGIKFADLISCLAVYIGVYIYSFCSDWKMTLFASCFIPFYLAAYKTLTTTRSKYAIKESQEFAKAGTIAQEVFSVIKTVVAFGGEKLESQRYLECLEKVKKVGYARGISAAFSFSFLFVTLCVGYSVCTWFGFYLVTNQKYSLSWETRNLAAVINVPKINNWKTETKLIPSEDTKIKSIQFINVNFSYPSRIKAKVIEGFNLDVKSGETIAIVGETGCGKSTIINLLLRFYDVTSGSISINGRDIRDYDTRWLRRQIGIVNQEPTLFPTTISKNISYGKTETTEDEITEAAKLANAQQFIEKLPSRHDTFVGDGGMQLSGGQKQRIAIARALIRNPEILILDEATSALDTQNEASVQDSIKKAREGRTTFIIAHRLSTMRNADKIIVVAAGKIVEQGNHEQLLNLRGKYYEHVQSQSRSTMENPNKKFVTEEIEKRKTSIGNGTVGSKNETQNHKEEQTVGNTGSNKQNSITKLLRMSWFNTFLLSLGIFGSLFHSFLFLVFYADALMQFLMVFANNDHSLSDRNFQLVKQLFIVNSIIAAAFIIAVILQFALLGIVGSRLAKELRKNIFNYFIQQTISVHLGIILNALGKLYISVFFMYMFCWELGLGQSVLLVLGQIASIYMKRVQMANSIATSKAAEESNEILRQVITNIRTVSSFGLEPIFQENFEKCNIKNHNKCKECFYNIVQSFVEMWAQIGMVMVIVLGTPLLLNNQITYVNIIRAIGTLVATNSLSQSLSVLPNIITAKNSLDKIFETIRYESKTIGNDSAVAETNYNETDVAIEFRNVSFKYPMRKNADILKKFTLNIKAGQTVALVGESGSGKSTCLQLLERFYEPHEGSINLNGKSIKSMDKCSLRRQMVIVQQEPALFDRSIAENIAYGDNTRQVTMDEIVKAAIIAQAHQFIVKLPQGYETLVGQRGAQLSGGQKQRIAIARALVRKSRIVLLDEATSALDTETEMAVHNAIIDNKGGATVVLVAHRSSTISNSDLICVVKDGKIVEMGLNSELMARKGHFYELYQSQEKTK